MWHCWMETVTTKLRYDFLGLVFHYSDNKAAIVSKI